ncbi:MAG: hypothetical protein JW840_01475 [Candidatus Thermoplasmatota archaeon]|nr:hypothetical protein [Candidatus Thermoplasmatota archaeon]
MKKRVLSIGSTGAVVIFMLVSINSAFALPSEIQKKTDQTVTQIITEEKLNDAPYIDPSIQLSRKHLPILKRALAQMGDDTRKDLMQNIINCLETQGNVTSKDVQRIVNESNVGLKAIHFMKLLVGHGPGSSLCFPFTLSHTPYALFFLLLPTLIPTCMAWEVQYNQDPPYNVPPDYTTSVAIGRFYKYDQHTHTGGLVIGFTGLAWAQIAGNLMHNCWGVFDFMGFGLLIIMG